jgi:hypothetical protein
MVSTSPGTYSNKQAALSITWAVHAKATPTTGSVKCAMPEKIIYISQHYFVLLACVTSCWGLGQLILPQSARRTMLHTLMALTAGMGITICALQGLAIMGQLRGPWILALLASGLLVTGRQWVKTTPQPIQEFAAWWSPLSVHAKGSIILLGLFFASTLPMPMVPPTGGDEAMYHLPHARAWVESGSLDIHGWLRYPWFPFNLDIPFAAALVLYDDVFAHLLGALPGWVCAGLLFQTAQRFTGVPGAAIASILWLQASRDQYAYAGVDLGASLFVFATYATYLQAKEAQQKSPWLILAAFFLGVTCGGKYQSLSFIPLLLLGLWLTDRSPSTVAKAAMAFLLPCGYWYIRNALLTGDPFQPMGGKIFGFTDWNLADFHAQFADLKVHTGWPQWYFWPLLLIPLFRPLRNHPYMPSALWICAYGIAVWLKTSHYPRYLLPLYPLMCILSVVAWGALFRHVAKKIAVFQVLHSPKRAKRSWAILLILFLPLLYISWYKELTQVAPTPASREALFHTVIPSYDALNYIKSHPSKKVYQIGLDDAIYFSDVPLYGDCFGPWRYSDYVLLPAQAFAQKLSAQGFDTFIIRTKVSMSTEQQADFKKYFSPVFSSNGVTVYRIQTPATSL